MPAIDPQISGVLDDRSQAGAMRSREVRGDVVAVPFHPYKYSTEALGAGVGYQEGLLTSGEYGYGTGINLAVNAFTESGSGLRVTVPFYGPLFGIQLLRTSSIPLDRISVGVDGEYFPVRGYNEFLTSRAVAGLVDSHGYCVVVDDLPDLSAGRAHVGEICLVSKAGGSVSATVHAYLVSRRAGYRPQPPALQPYTVALTASAVAIPKGAAGDTQGRFVRKVVYYNADTVTRTVLLKNGTTVIDRLSLATLTRGEFDFGDVAAAPTTITHQAGEANTTNPVQATVWFAV